MSGMTVNGVELIAFREEGGKDNDVPYAGCGEVHPPSEGKW